MEHINRTGGVVAGALPLLYGMAEEIVTDVTPRAEEPGRAAGGPPGLGPPPLPAARRGRLRPAGARRYPARSSSAAVGAPAGDRAGGGGGVLADPLVLPGLVVLLVVALRPVDRDQLAGDLLPVGRASPPGTS